MRYAQYGQAYTFYAPLPESNTTAKVRLNPVINAGDFTFVADGVLIGNMTNLPDVFPAGGRLVRFRLTAAEMTCKSWMVQGIAIGGGSNWGDSFFAGETINNAAAQVPVFDTNVTQWKGVAAPNNTGDAFARLGAPTLATVSADIAEINSGTDAANVKIDTIHSKLPAGNIADNDNVDTIETAISLILADTATIKDSVDTVESSLATITGKLPVGDIAEETTSQSILSALGAGMIDVNVVNWKGAPAPDNTGDAFARLGAPVLGTVTADIANATESVEVITPIVSGISSKMPPGTVASEAVQIDIKNDTTAIIAGLPTGDPATQASVDAIAADVIAMQADVDNVVSSNIEILNGVNSTVAKLPSGNIADNSLLSTVNTTSNTISGNVTSILNKIPSEGNISNLNLDSSFIDGVTLRHALELLIGMVDGKFVVDSVAGTVTFYKRNNSTPLTIVRPTTEGRTRLTV